MSKNLLVALCLGLLVQFAGKVTAKEPEGTVVPVELRSKSGGRVWVYLPTNTPPGAKAALVMVPPAGSRLFHGMSLSDGDRDEHIPYVDSGLAVVSFDISGPWPETNTPEAQRKALREFANAKGGLTDARAALLLALEKFPQLDGQRVYVAGHSSAGTLALQMAAALPNVRGCIAFAPITDIEARLGTRTLKALDSLSPGMAKFLHEASPANLAESIRCPVFLFHADDDSNVSAASIAAFQASLTAHHKPGVYVSTPSGGHYDAMIRSGIPKAISWIGSDAKTPGTTRTKD